MIEFIFAEFVFDFCQPLSLNSLPALLCGGVEGNGNAWVDLRGGGETPSCFCDAVTWLVTNSASQTS